MLLRDRNHACVVVWSLGNESGYGAAHDAMAAWIRRVDPTRRCTTKGDRQDLHDAGERSGVRCTRNPRDRGVVARAGIAVRPSQQILHAMGN
jgi:beta-galactosidase